MSRIRISGDSHRCVEGRWMRHDPQHDDPELETDVGICEECGGAGCDRLESIDAQGAVEADER